MFQHPIVATALAEERQAHLRHQADQIRQIHGHPNGRPRRPIVARWWRAATRPAQA